MDEDETRRTCVSRQARCATDDHGRHLSTTATAAARYRLAQRVGSAGLVEGHLRAALETDPGFAVAAADLGAEAGPRRGAPPLTTWERHHCEVVATARRAPTMAAALLLEHLTEVGCDPLAVGVVAEALRTGGHDDALAEVLAHARPCHAPSWASGAAGGRPV